MQDVFIELEKIKQEIEILKNALKNHKLYFEDIIEYSYDNSILIQEAELCEDNIDFTEYTKLVSNELKNIMMVLKLESKSKQEKLYYLEDLKSQYESEVINLSTFTINEFNTILSLYNINGMQNIEIDSNHYNIKNKKVRFLIICDDMIVINPILNLMPNEIIDFIKFYINIKFNFKNENYSILDIYRIYQNTELNELKLV